MSKSKKGIPSKRMKPIIQYDLYGNMIKEWESITLAGKYSGVLKRQIHLCLNGKRESYNGFTFKYKSSSKIN